MFPSREGTFYLIQKKNQSQPFQTTEPWVTDTQGKLRKKPSVDPGSGDFPSLHMTLTLSLQQPPRLSSPASAVRLLQRTPLLVPPGGAGWGEPEGKVPVTFNRKQTRRLKCNQKFYFLGMQAMRIQCANPESSVILNISGGHQALENQTKGVDLSSEIPTNNSVYCVGGSISPLRPTAWPLPQTPCSFLVHFYIVS